MLKILSTIAKKKHSMSAFVNGLLETVPVSHSKLRTSHPLGINKYFSIISYNWLQKL